MSESDYVEVKEPMYKEVKVPFVKKSVEDIAIEGLPYINTETYTLNKKDKESYVVDVIENKNKEYLLYRYLHFFTNLNIPKLERNLDFEQVFICFESLPHIESIIRNNIFLLGEEFSHTIVCCKQNETRIKYMCRNLNVKFVVLPYETVFLEDYNNLMLDKEFYNNFTGKYLFFTNSGGILRKELDMDSIKEELLTVPLIGVKNKENLLFENYSIRKKEFLIKNLDYLNKKRAFYQHIDDYDKACYYYGEFIKFYKENYYVGDHVKILQKELLNINDKTDMVLKFNEIIEESSKELEMKTENIKKKYFLKEVPENYYFSDSFEKNTTFNLNRNGFIWKSFFTDGDNCHEEKFINYLEKMVGIYF